MALIKNICYLSFSETLERDEGGQGHVYWGRGEGGMEYLRGSQVLTMVVHVHVKYTATIIHPKKYVVPS